MMKSQIQHIYKPSPSGGGAFYAWFSSMHTRVDILFCSAEAEEKLLSVVEAIYDLLHHLESIANYYDPGSELAIVNRTAFSSPVSLSGELYDMIELCLAYHSKTLGCFDITVHSENYNSDTIHSLCLSTQEHTLFFERPGVTINLSGFLKGYALDKIKLLLKTYQLEQALINLGNSSVLALGNPPSGRGGWKVNDLLLHDACLTTSGNDSNERRHIISPHDATLVEGRKQIAVVTKDGALGEILSTGLFAATPQQRAFLLKTFAPLILDHSLIGY